MKKMMSLKTMKRIGNTALIMYSLIVILGVFSTIEGRSKKLQEREDAAVASYLKTYQKYLLKKQENKFLEEKLKIIKAMSNDIDSLLKPRP